MPDLFDPSKLNFDLSDKKDKEKKRNKQINKKEENKSNLKESKVPKDILESINLEEKVDKNEKIKTSKNNKDQKNEKNKNQDNNTEKEEIIDINLTSIESLVNLLDDKEYDFLIIEPSERNVKISLSKNSKVVDVRYIRYHIYSKILINIKQVTNLEIEEIDKEQEGKWIFDSKDKKFTLITKTVPSTYWEKVFLKIREVLKEKKAKRKQKASLAKILLVLLSATFVSLILGWTFITFVVLNAKTITDVQFFYSLWINLNDINSFIWKIVFFIFSILLFIETVFTAIFLFKTFLTKKKYKKKKVLYAMISIVALIITTISGSIWMVIDKKIKELPNWEEIAKWNIQLYDNDKIVSKFFNEKWALITDTNELIWPLTVKYDLTSFEKREAQKWLTIKRYIWNFWWKEIEELKPTLIKEFNEKGNFEVSLTVEETWLNWKIIRKEVENIPSIIITSVVNIIEKPTTNGWKTVHFDATDLEKLWRVEWYLKDDLDNPIWDKYIFEPTKIFFDEDVIFLKIKRTWKEDNNFDKVFIIKWWFSNSIEWKIWYKQSFKNDFEYTIKIIDPKTDFWEWFIDEFEWIFWNKTIVKKADPTNLEASSEVTHKFNSYWENTISVIIKDSSGQFKKLTKIINIPKRLRLKKGLDITDNWKKIWNIKYISKNNEYFINWLWVPTTIKLDWKFVKPFDDNYTLENISWDFNDDQWIDAIWKTVETDIILEWNHTIIVNYKFVNRKNKKDIISIKERIYIEWIKKDAILDLRIEKESDYVPMNVRFDASKSSLKNDNIVKFIYDYWDWIIEARDAINPWHKYNSPWDYKVKLTVVWESWKQYSITKDLILKPKPQKVKIWVSMKSAPIWQGISFFSNESEGQIIWYFWDFWDWKVSTEANPTHSYDKPWTYKVTLKLDFINNNSLKDEMEIDIHYGN